MCTFSGKFSFRGEGGWRGGRRGVRADADVGRWSEGTGFCRGEEREG
jgi:hypothetical protein